MSERLECKRCGVRMALVATHDTGTEGPPNIAWNLYACWGCGAVARQNVWDFAGVVWIAADDVGSSVPRLPRHISLSIEHNRHRVFYEPIAEHIRNLEAGHDGRLDWVAEGERERCIETGELWECTWYPDTPVGSYTLYAATLEALLAAIAEDEDE